ncbi:MAG TPA: YHS domain-containing protein [Anaerolineae bacterium]
MYDEFFSKAHELLSQGLPFATAVVVRAEKPTSARPGDKAIVTAEGVMHGWIGGSCAQPTVIEEAMKALADGTPRFIRLSTDPESHTPREGLLDRPMTCFSGGTLEIYIEPQLPAPRLRVVGNLPVAQALARLGKVMNYQVIDVDPDMGGAGMPDADDVVTDLDGMAGKITPLTYVVVASHGRYDEVALEHALRSKAAYVALVASKARSAAVLEYLAAQGLTGAELDRLKYPAGLNIQAMRGDEIALSIMAEIVQRRRSGEQVDVSSLVAELAPEAAEALDPVCGMAVQVAGAEHVFEYDGQTFYFCCAGCRAAFAEEPEKYLTRPAPAGEAIDPVCGMTVDIATARYISEYGGELFYFCAAGCKLAFDKAPESYVGDAERR